MGKETLIIVFGAWVAVLPFLGFPNRWDAYLFAITGLLVVGLGISLQRSALRRQRRRAERLQAHASQTTDETSHATGHEYIS